ncbi:hypothetical protein GGR50DRAFT_694152 [Xylaria sp. CBS 124048]|nr:hypothetical protein GGR50DRAFT_694152 [Xylaria sp. CBS 124048]
MESTHDDNHGLPYPLDPTIPAPEEPEPDPSRRYVRTEKLRLNIIGVAEDPYEVLRRTNTILVIDDSDSMQSCWDEVGDFLRIVAPVCIEYDPDGIDIEFVNHRAHGSLFTGRTGYEHIGLMKGRLDMHDNVAGIYHNVKPKGKCRMDSRLASILDPYMRQCEAYLRQSGGKKFISPLNIIVVSDLKWDEDEDELAAITRTARRLDILGAPKCQVGVQLFRVGDAGRALSPEDVQFVDDKVWKEKGVRDIVDMTTWTGKPGELSSDGILKVILGGVRKSIDFMEI